MQECNYKTDKYDFTKNKKFLKKNKYALYIKAIGFVEYMFPILKAIVIYLSWINAITGSKTSNAIV